MPKLKKVRRSKKYNHNVNRKRLRNKLQKLPNIDCPQIKKAWENNKSTKLNLAIMGLAYDANEVFKIPSIKKELMNKVKNDGAENISSSESGQQVKKFVPRKIEVAKELEAQAKASRERMFRLPKGQVQFITYLLNKYGDNYKAMARDRRNYDQLTWRKIRSKINVFKNIPEQYAEYLVEKGEIVLEDPTTLEETRKKIAEENLKKYCEPKKQKTKKRAVSIWIEEDINNDEDQNGNKNDEIDNFDTLKTLEDKNEEKNRINGKEKKLKLFADDDNEEKRNENKRSKKTVMKNVGKLDNKKVNEKSRKKENVEVKTSRSSRKQDSSESEEELDGGNNGIDFKDLDDFSDEELSDDDILDDDFATDSDDDSD